MSTTRTTLRGVTGVYSDYFAATFLSFVLDIFPKSSIRPLMHRPTLRFAVPFRAVANFGQVFHDNGGAWLYRLNHLPTDHVIAIGAKSLHLLRQLFEPSFSGRCAFALKRTLQSKVPSLRNFSRSADRKTGGAM